MDPSGMTLCRVAGRDPADRQHGRSATETRRGDHGLQGAPTWRRRPVRVPALPSAAGRPPVTALPIPRTENEADDAISAPAAGHNAECARRDVQGERAESPGFRRREHALVAASAGRRRGPPRRAGGNMEESRGPATRDRRSHSRRAARGPAIATCVSWPHECITASPTARRTAARSLGIGSASMSREGSPTARPGRRPATATTEP